LSRRKFRIFVPKSIDFRFLILDFRFWLVRTGLNLDSISQSLRDAALNPSSLFTVLTKLKLPTATASDQRFAEINFPTESESSPRGCFRVIAIECIGGCRTGRVVDFNNPAARMSRLLNCANPQMTETKEHLALGAKKGTRWDSRV